MNENHRRDQLKVELTEFFGNNHFSISILNEGASVRRYYLLKFNKKHYFPRREVVIMDVPRDSIHIIDDYLNISYYLRRKKIPRPRVFEIYRDAGWIFLARARGTRLDLYMRQNPDQTEQIYRRLIGFLIEMQEKAAYEKHCPAFQRYFDTEKFLFEFDFHVRQQLLEYHFRKNLAGADRQHFLDFANEVSGFLSSTLPIFVHRDFQSSNIFFDPKRSSTPFQILDFQDARSGNLVYDLVALLWDSYVDIPEIVREQLVWEYFEQQPLIRKHFSKESFIKNVDFAIIQRKLHDAGAFVNADRKLAKAAFLQYVDAAIEMVLQKSSRYPEFKEMNNLLRNLLEEKRAENYNI